MNVRPLEPGQLCHVGQVMKRFLPNRHDLLLHGTQIDLLGTGVTFAPKRGSHSPLNNNNLNMLLNPLGFNLGTRGLLGGLGFRGGHGGICWLVSLFHMLLNPLGFNLGTRGHLGGLGFRGGHGGICWLVSLFHMLLNPLGFNLGTRGHLGGLGFRGGHGGICWLVSQLTCVTQPFRGLPGDKGHGGIYLGTRGIHSVLEVDWNGSWKVTSKASSKLLEMDVTT